MADNKVGQRVPGEWSEQDTSVRIAPSPSRSGDDRFASRKVRTIAITSILVNPQLAITSTNDQVEIAIGVKIEASGRRMASNFNGLSVGQNRLGGTKCHCRRRLREGFSRWETTRSEQARENQ
ncbi:MAG: hypothetical protein R3C05_14955 [Pirellulaceae bacterium]